MKGTKIMKLNKKTIITLLSVVLVVALAIGGTIAWLQGSATKSVTLVGTDKVDVSISGEILSGTNDTTVIPGKSVTFDPKLSVTNTVDAFLFVEISNTVFDVTTADVWNPLTGHDGVYYQKLTGTHTNSEISIIKNGSVTYPTTLDNSSVAALNNTTISVKAYAIQADYLPNLTGTLADDAAVAWGIVSTS